METSVATTTTQVRRNMKKATAATITTAPHLELVPDPLLRHVCAPDVLPGVPLPPLCFPPAPLPCGRRRPRATVLVHAHVLLPLDAPGPPLREGGGVVEGEAVVVDLGLVAEARLHPGAVRTLAAVLPSPAGLARGALIAVLSLVALQANVGRAWTVLTAQGAKFLPERLIHDGFGNNKQLVS